MNCSIVIAFYFCKMSLCFFSPTKIECILVSSILNYRLFSYSNFEFKADEINASNVLGYKLSMNNKTKTIQSKAHNAYTFNLLWYLISLIDYRFLQFVFFFGNTYCCTKEERNYVKPKYSTYQGFHYLCVQVKMLFRYDLILLFDDEIQHLCNEKKKLLHINKVFSLQFLQFPEYGLLNE